MDQGGVVLMLHYTTEQLENIALRAKFACHSCEGKMYAIWKDGEFRLDPCDQCCVDYFDKGKDEGIERMKHRIKDLLEY
jgi:hypothetical protein